MQLRITAIVVFLIPAVSQAAFLYSDVGLTVQLGRNNVLSLDIGGTNRSTINAENEFDWIFFRGGVELDGTLALRLDPAFNPKPGDTFDLLDWSWKAGHFHTIDLSNAQLPNGWTWDTTDIDFQANPSGNGSVTIVPEPASLATLGFASALLLRRRRR